MQRLTHAPLVAVLFAACSLLGCSLVVEGTLQDKQPVDDDGGRTGLACTTTEQCLGFEVNKFNCMLQCVGASAGTQGTCEPVAAGTPDGTPCGGVGSGQICVARTCVTRECGDGYVDREATPPEYCDDGDDNDLNTCNNMCTRSCTGMAPANCNDDTTCNGSEICRASGFCGGTPLEADGTACRLSSGETGMCMRGACIAE